MCIFWSWEEPVDKPYSAHSYSQWNLISPIWLMWKIAFLLEWWENFCLSFLQRKNSARISWCPLMLFGVQTKSQEKTLNTRCSPYKQDLTKPTKIQPSEFSEALIPSTYFQIAEPLKWGHICLCWFPAVSKELKISVLSLVHLLCPVILPQAHPHGSNLQYR